MIDVHNYLKHSNTESDISYTSTVHDKKVCTFKTTTFNNQFNQTQRDAAYKRSHKYLSIIKYAALYIFFTLVSLTHNPIQVRRSTENKSKLGNKMHLKSH